MSESQWKQHLVILITRRVGSLSGIDPNRKPFPPARCCLFEQYRSDRKYCFCPQRKAMDGRHVTEGGWRCIPKHAIALRGGGGGDCWRFSSFCLMSSDANCWRLEVSALNHWRRLPPSVAAAQFTIVAAKGAWDSVHPDSFAPFLTPEPSAYLSQKQSPLDNELFLSRARQSGTRYRMMFVTQCQHLLSSKP